MEESQDPEIQDESRRNFLRGKFKEAKNEVPEPKPEQTTDNPGKLLDERGGVTRRGFLIGGAITTLATFLGLTTIAEGQKKNASKLPEQKPQTPPTSTKTITTYSTPEKPTNLETLSDHDLLNRALSLPIESPKRKEAEIAYHQRAKTLDQIHKGFWVINYFGSDQDNHRHLRAELIDRRFKLRQEGKIQKSPKIPQEMINWAIEQKTHPEILALCLENEERAMRIIQKLIDKSYRETGNIGKFRPDFVDPERFKELPADLQKAITEKKVAADILMINAAGLAKLICTETGLGFPMVVGKDQKGNDIRDIITYGFTNTGFKSATELASKNPGNLAALEELLRSLQDKTGLNFSAGNISGSSMGDGDIDQGAIGPQFMPKTALTVKKLFEDVGEDFNILDPADGIVAAWVFLALSQHLSNRPGKDYREGYVKGLAPVTTEYRQFALGKWNQNQKQINDILAAANDFAPKFLGPLIYDQSFTTLSKN